MRFLQHLPVLIILIPLMSAVVIPVIGRVNKFACWIVSCVALFFSLSGSIYLLNKVVSTGKVTYHLGGWKPPWGIEYSIDHLNGFVITVIAFIAFVVAFYAEKSVEHEIEERKIPAFYSIYMLLITGLMGIVITGDIFNLYVFLEISSLAGYALVALGKHRNALVASFNYLIFGTIAGTFILIGIGYIYMQTGTLNIADLRERLPEFYDSTVILAAFAFFTVGLCLKVALFPLHFWLPKVYNYSPSVVSSIMAAVGTKVGLYVMLRVMFTVFKVEFSVENVPIAKILIIISSIAIVVGSILAIAQTKIKLMLAYSSIGQVGYIVLGATLTNQIAMTGSIIHILNHALMKGSLFLIVGCLVYKAGIERIDDLEGMGKRMPSTMGAFTVSGLSMIGVPLTVGFVSKWHIAIGALDAGMWYFVPVLIISSLLTAVYFWRIIEKIYFHEEPGLLHEDRRVNVNIHWDRREKREALGDRRINSERRESRGMRRKNKEDRRRQLKGNWQPIEQWDEHGRWEVVKKDRRVSEEDRRQFMPDRRSLEGIGRRTRDYNLALIKRGEAPWTMLAPTLVLSGACIFFGIAAKIPVAIAEKAAAMLLR